MIPVGDFLRRRTTPYVNWALIATNVLVFLYMLSLSTETPRFVAVLSEADRFLLDWGFVPACVADYFGVSTSAPPRELAFFCPTDGREPVQLVTSMFLHAGWLHLLGNMLFLWIFGDNVEDRLGHWRYLAFYLICGLAASATQIAISTGTVVPTVGASGAIAGVLGAYLIMFPRVTVQVVFIFLPFLPFFVPAVALIGIWFVTQLFAGLGEIGQATAGSGVAWWAHVGGFLTGAILVTFFKKRSRVRVMRITD